jgi:hypothetical protein
MRERKIVIPYGYVHIREPGESVSIEPTYSEKIALNLSTEPLHSAYNIYLNYYRQTGLDQRYIISADFEPHLRPVYTIGYTGESELDEWNQHSVEYVDEMLKLMVRSGIEEATQHATCGGKLVFRKVFVHPVDARPIKFKAAARCLIHLTQLNPFNAPENAVIEVFKGLL